MLVTLLCDWAMQGTSACAFFLHLSSQNKLTIKYVLQFLTESGHQVTKFVPCWPVPVHELHSCIAVRQADKEPNSCRCNCPNRNYSTCTSIALKVPKDIKKKKSKIPTWPLAPAAHTHWDCTRLPLFEDQLCQKQWHLEGRILHLQIKGSRS